VEVKNYKAQRKIFARAERFGAAALNPWFLVLKAWKTRLSA
jgi:hypothetical protein